MNKTLIFLFFLMVFRVAAIETRLVEGRSTETSETSAAEDLYVNQALDRTADVLKSPDMHEEIRAETAQSNVSVYRGNWFDIEYPSDFRAAPAGPLTTHDDRSFVQTDEAVFTSADNTVQFFVYSPLWAGEPNDYLVIAETEEIVSEQTSRVKEAERPGQAGDREVRWVTVKAVDGSYYRSFMSVREQIGTGSDLHHVFGIRYNDDTAYQKYRDAYIQFRESLNQYAD